MYSHPDHYRQSQTSREAGAESQGPWPTEGKMMRMTSNLYLAWRMRNEMRKLFVIFSLMYLFLYLLVSSKIAIASIVDADLIGGYFYYGKGFTFQDVEKYTTLVQVISSNNTDNSSVEGIPGNQERINVPYLENSIIVSPGRYLYLEAFRDLFPQPGDEWSGSYNFYVNGNLDYSINVPNGSFNKLKIVDTLSISGNDIYKPIIKWNSVPDATGYYVRIYEFIDDRLHVFDNQVFNFVIPSKDTEHYSFSYQGDLFNPNIYPEYGGKLTISVVAINSMQADNVLDISYNSFVYNSSPIPIPGAFWLVGSGLLGLAGIRRRLHK